MEVLDAKKEGELLILNINSSEAKISFFKEVEENEDVTLQLSPTLFINLDERSFAIKIKAVFYNSSEDTAISSPIAVVISFAAKDFESIFSLTKESIQIMQMQVVLKMLDTTIGTIRGVLYEQTKGTTLSDFSLPIITMQNFIKELKIKVIRKKEN
ncbi:hypothetical protein [Bacteroides sp.]|uniref:hypothetical protein n=1 Tax=Bacteroides sp. TaxID=29523 RepID=UPI0026174C4B|nr:hypothetical protein [Bacteroides sp.]